ncbi:hypothetical protein J0H33_00615 [bacterium]|nr:hypothetical protein [bacterium]
MHDAVLGCDRPTLVHRIIIDKADEPVARGVLVAIAQAIDPSLDVTKLTEQPSGVVEPQPADSGGSVASPPMAGQ